MWIIVGPNLLMIKLEIYTRSLVLPIYVNTSNTVLRNFNSKIVTENESWAQLSKMEYSIPTDFSITLEKLKQLMIPQRLHN